MYFFLSCWCITFSCISYDAWLLHSCMLLHYYNYCFSLLSRVTVTMENGGEYRCQDLNNPDNFDSVIVNVHQSTAERSNNLFKYLTVVIHFKISILLCMKYILSFFWYDLMASVCLCLFFTSYLRTFCLLQRLLQSWSLQATSSKYPRAITIASNVGLMRAQNWPGTSITGFCLMAMMDSQCWRCLIVMYVYCYVFLCHPNYSYLRQS